MSAFLKWSKLVCIPRSQNWDIWEDWSPCRVQGPLVEQGSWKCFTKDYINITAFLSLSWCALRADGCISKVHLHLSEHFSKTGTNTWWCNVIPKPSLRPNLLLIHIICLLDCPVITQLVSLKEENLDFSKHLCIDSEEHFSHTQTYISSFCCGISSCGDLTHTINTERARCPLLREAMLSASHRVDWEL